jgi:L-cysteine S-thiosulfotransferase
MRRPLAVLLGSLCMASVAPSTAAQAVDAAASAAPAAPSPDPRRSGRLDMGPSTRAMQDDDAQNPGMLWLQTGQQQWDQATGPRQRSCASCHQAPATLASAAPRYPRMSPDGQRPLTLAQRINHCRTEQQGAPPLATESQELLGLETLLGHAARGRGIAPDADPRLGPWTARGRQRYQQRLGQLDLACTQCHDRLAGGRLGGSLIPQAHPTGYPQYRLEWQGMGSLQRRLRNCLVGVRAEPWPDGAIEWTELELHLKQRAAGMPLETPAVRP